MKTLNLYSFWCSRKCRFIILFVLLSLGGSAQKVMMQGWWWDYPPTYISNYQVVSWGKNFLNYVPDLAEAGFTDIWLPPLSRPSTYPSTGYDVTDYYDLGGGPLGNTDFGTRQDVENLVNALKLAGIRPMADMIYNQRTGGQWENNPAVKAYMTDTMRVVPINTDGDIDGWNGYNPYPSDRWRAILPVGGNTGIDTGWFYFKIRSASLNTFFQCKPYSFQVSSTKMPIATDSTGDTWEFEPNNGGECGDSDNYYNFTYNKYADVDGPNCYSPGCGIDEFRLHLDTSMYNVEGDTLIITMKNDNASIFTPGTFTDHYLYDLWSHTGDSSIVSRVIYQSQTDFTHMPSGRGYMNWQNFKPDGRSTTLAGDWDLMEFYYDIDQYQPATISTLGAWQEWMFDSIGIEGMRVDAVKNYPDIFAAQMIDSLYFHRHSPGIVVGEYYDGNPNDLTSYLGTVKSEMSPEDTINMAVFDFALRFPLQDACNLTDDVRNIFTSGIVNGGGGKAVNSVTWVNNHDFRTPDTYISANPELAYAYIITNPLIGTPCVFLTDYFTSNFLKGRIKGLIHASQKYTFGSDNVDYIGNIGAPYTQNVTSGYASNTLIYQFHNPVTNRPVIVAINFSHDTLNMTQQVNTTYAPAGTIFTDIFGISQTPTVPIATDGTIHVIIPPRSFTMYVEGADLVDSIVSMGDTLDTIAIPSAIIPVQPTSPAVQTNPVTSIYPNPFTHQINLQLGADVQGQMQVDIYDISGRMLYTQQWSSPTMGTLQINPPPFASDIYLLKVSANNEVYFYKLAKN